MLQDCRYWLWFDSYYEVLIMVSYFSDACQANKLYWKHLPMPENIKQNKITTSENYCSYIDWSISNDQWSFNIDISLCPHGQTLYRKYHTASSKGWYLLYLHIKHSDLKKWNWFYNHFCAIRFFKKLIQLSPVQYWFICSRPKIFIQSLITMYAN